MLGNSQTDTKMNAEDTLSGFQDFLIQLIINDRANKKIKKEKNNNVRWDSNPLLTHWDTLRDGHGNHSAIPTLRNVWKWIHSIEIILRYLLMNDYSRVYLRVQLCVSMHCLQMCTHEHTFIGPLPGYRLKEKTLEILKEWPIFSLSLSVCLSVFLSVYLRASCLVYEVFFWMRGPLGMSNNNGYITILNVEGHKHTRRAGFHNPCGFVTDTYIHGPWQWNHTTSNMSKEKMYVNFIEL